MNQLHFYYGMEHPPEAFLHAWQESILITQPYHPLSYTDRWKQYIAQNNQHYFYFNCYKIPVSEYESTLKTSKIVSYDLQWDSVILDINDPANFCYLRNKAEELLRKKSCDGLFLDDLDCHHLTKNKEVLLELINSIKKTREQNYILNRGFEIWEHVQDIHAIILESFVPHQFPETKDLDWFETIIENSIIPFKQNNPGKRIQILRYEKLGAVADTNSPVNYERIGQIQSQLDLLGIKIQTVNERLDQWPKFLN
jgi:hypothetical protein